MGDIDEIKRLSPEERIKRLRKLESEKRKEIEEAEKLMKESVGELERQEKIRQEIPVPQMKAVDVGELFTQEERQVFATKRYQKIKPADEHEEKPAKKKENTLEEEVLKEQPGLTPNQIESQKAYGEALAGEKPNRLYDLAREAYDEFRETGMVDQGKMYALDVAFRAKDDAAGGEYKSASQQLQEKFSSAKSIVQYLRGK